MKALLLVLSLQAYHEATGKDGITGLVTSTKCGRPQWDSFFRKITEDTDFTDRSVFFCGPPVLKRILEKKCDKFNIQFRAETF
tara:strand:- start:184 stop:432 length:249 start_codon:yes stop_codon:yes gene_type:complete